MDGIGKRRMSVVPTGANSVNANADVILTGMTTQIGFSGLQTYQIIGIFNI